MADQQGRVDDDLLPENRARLSVSFPGCGLPHPHTARDYPVASAPCSAPSLRAQAASVSSGLAPAACKPTSHAQPSGRPASPGSAAGLLPSGLGVRSIAYRHVRGGCWYHAGLAEHGAAYELSALEADLRLAWLYGFAWIVMWLGSGEPATKRERAVRQLVCERADELAREHRLDELLLG